MSEWYGWHFLPASRKLELEQSPRDVVLGAWMRYAGDEPVEMCARGMHASRRAINALSFERGPVVCWVELRGGIVEAGDKAVAEERRVVAWADATAVLRRFAVWCAARALRREKVTDPRCWNALRVAARHACGKATDVELAAARVAAGVAAWVAAGVAAGDAAGDAAWVAARVAARDAARDAAWGAEVSAQNEYLERQLSQLLHVEVTR
jgi:hypothetical protein